MTDNPVADQIANEARKAKQKVKGVLKLNDVLEGITLKVGSYIMDAIVNVTVIQHGSRDFEIESIELPKNLVLIHDMRTNIETMIKYNVKTQNVETNRLLESFNSAVNLVVLEKARNTTEDLWNYELVD